MKKKTTAKSWQMRQKVHLTGTACIVDIVHRAQKIDIAMVNKYLDLALIQDEVPETLKTIMLYWNITQMNA